MRRLLWVLVVSMGLAIAPTQALSCYAWTSCPNGRIAQCQLYGPSCSAWIQPYRWVECRGWDLWGNWVVTRDYCWF